MGGATWNYRRKAQTLLNSAARWASGKPRRTKIINLMEALDWMTIQEMITVNSANLMWKMLYQSKPLKVAEKLAIDRKNMLINIFEPRIIFTEHNFTLRASREWNKFPEYIRKNDKLQN